MMEIKVGKQRGIAPVTALCASKRIPPVVYCGIGSVLHVQYHQSLRNFQRQVFDHAIQGIKEVNETLIVFGDKSVAVFRIPGSNFASMDLLFEFVNLPDLILDVEALDDDCNTLAVGYAHNFVELLAYHPDKHSFVLQQRVQCPVICVLFSMSFKWNTRSSKGEIVVASGTSFGKLILWSFAYDVINNQYHRTASSDALIKYDATSVPTYSVYSTHSGQQSSVNNNNDAAVRMLFVLLGHEGVIFRIVWCEGTDILATVSDDRTVRVWSASLGQQLYCGWGHVARLWDVLFIGSGWNESQESASGTKKWIATCSEDGTIRLWDTSLMETSVGKDDNNNNNSSSSSSNSNVTSSYEKKMNNDNDGEGEVVGDVSKVESRGCICVMRSHPMDLWRMVCIQDAAAETILICGSNDGCVRAWNLEAQLAASPHDLEVAATITCLVPSFPSPSSSSLTTATALSIQEQSSTLPVEDSADVVVVDSHATSENDSSTTASVPSTKKRKKSQAAGGAPSSKRENGVCAIFVVPWRNELCFLLVLLDGALWMAQQSNSDTGFQWHPLLKLDSPVTTATTYHRNKHGESINDGWMCHCACALPNGSVSLVSISSNSRASSPCSFTADLQSTWRANELRVVQMQFVELSAGQDAQEQEAPLLLATFVVGGLCKFWPVNQPQLFAKADTSMDIDNTTATAAMTPYYFVGVTGGKHQIASVATFVPSHQRVAGNNNIHINNNSSSSNCANSQEQLESHNSGGHLVVGDSHGCLSIYELNSEHWSHLLTSPSASTLTLPLVSFFSKLHGTDPVSCLHRPPLTASGESNGFISAGHDGALCFFRPRSNAMEAAIKGPFEMVNTLSTLPVRTPTAIYRVGSNEDDNTSALVVCGFQGSLFIAWDMTWKQELMRVEGGSWKRSHCTFVGHPDSSIAWRPPQVVFGSALPVGRGSAIAVQRNYPCPSLAVDISPADDSSIGPICHPPHGLRNTSCCTAIVTYPTVNEANQSQSFVAVGSEDGTVLFLDPISLQRMQELQMPGGVAAKTLCSGWCWNGNGEEDPVGIVVAAGGRLRYSVWCISSPMNDKFASERGEYIGREDYLTRESIAAVRCQGSIWNRASQDHRILSSACCGLPANSSQREGDSKISPFIIMFGDSRGRLTLASHVEGLLPRSHAEPASSSSSESNIEDYQYPMKYLTLIEDVAASDIPLTSCSLQILHHQLSSVSSEPTEEVVSLLACIGDTSGNVSLWVIQLSVNHSAETVVQLRCPSMCLYSFQAHTMGTNCLSMWLRSEVGGCNNMMQVSIVSGGDDQAVTFMSGVMCNVAPSSSASSSSASGSANDALVFQCQYMERVDGSSGSAIKSIRFLPTGAGNGSGVGSAMLVVFVGYDQRLNVLQLHHAQQPQSQQDQDNGDGVELKLTRLGDGFACCVGKAIPKTELFTWCGGDMVVVGDVADMDVSKSSTTGTSLVSVCGEGIQLFTISRES